MLGSQGTEVTSASCACQEPPPPFPGLSTGIFMHDADADMLCLQSKLVPTPPKGPPPKQHWDLHVATSTMHACMHASACICMDLYACACMCMQVHACACMCTHAGHLCACIDTVCVMLGHACTQTSQGSMHACTHALESPGALIAARPMRACSSPGLACLSHLLCGGILFPSAPEDPQPPPPPATQCLPKSLQQLAFQHYSQARSADARI